MLGRSVREVLGMQQAVPRTGAQRLYIMAQVFIHTVEKQAVFISNLSYRRLGTGVTCLPDGAVLKCSSAHLSCASCSLMSRLCWEWKQARKRLLSASTNGEGSCSVEVPARGGWGSSGEQKHTHTELVVQ